MPKARIRQFEAWSYSRLTEWEKCAFKAKSKHLDKIAEPENPKGAEGTAAHTDAERYATGAVNVRPKTLDRFAEEFDALRKIKRILRPEFELALDAAWKQTTWFKTSGNPDPWVRIKMDLTYDKAEGSGKKAPVIRNVIDYKNGIVRAEDEDQLELYAIGGLSMEPFVDVVRVALWYLKEGVIKPENGRVFVRSELPALIKKWGKRVAPMMADTAFIPRPGRHCGWCHLTKAKKGPCPF